MLLLNINRKVCMESPIAFDFRELERSLSKSLRFRSLICRKGAELDHVLLFRHQ